MTTLAVMGWGSGPVPIQRKLKNALFLCAIDKKKEGADKSTPSLFFIAKNLLRLKSLPIRICYVPGDVPIMN